MRTLAFTTLLLSALLGLSAAEAQNKVLATVNGEAITEADVNLAVEDVASEYPNLPPQGVKDLTLDFLIEMKVVAQKAKADKIDQSDEFKRRMAYVQQRVMMQQLLMVEAKKVASDVALKKYYDEQIGQIKPVEEVRARHILVEGEDDAKKIAARVKGGEDFAKVAKEASKDPGSGAEGGDLGFFTRDRMVPEFAEAAFAMKPGEVSAPVKSQFGWHVIKVEERRQKPAPTFDQVKDRIAQALAGKAQGEFLTQLRASAKIVKTEAPKKAEEPKNGEPKKN
ncbi:MAG: peptidyl-prolyl cis-trans isomerase [Beijerinckiaceae bacterium]|nr:MAG: peptidyl-prolyl cis-trans isomerase [Beijerinckiaceae bacterium]